MEYSGEVQVPPNNIDVRDLYKCAELHSITGCVFLPVRPESVQLRLRTGSALLQMTGRPFRGQREGWDAQCRGYRDRMKGHFVPCELL